MSYDNRVHALLIQISNAIDQVIAWNVNIHDPEDYYNSPEGMKDLAASCMLIEAIGESIKQIDKITDSQLLVNRPEIPWRDVIGIRNHIAHGYFDIDGDIVFDVVKNNIHTLKDAITYFLENY